MVASDNLLELIRGRRSMRRYDNSAGIDREEIEQLVEAARWAPSPTNRQPWKFVSVVDREIIGKMSLAIEAVSNQSLNADCVEYKQYLQNFIFFKDAPAVILVFYRKTMNHLNASEGAADGINDINFKSTLLAVGAAIQNMLLMAHSMGLSTCWMTGPLLAGGKIEEIVNICPPWNLVSIVPVGRGTCEGETGRKDIGLLWEER